MITTGLDGLDDLLDGGLHLGDNIVWVGSSRTDLDAVCAPFLESGATPGRVIDVGTDGAERSLDPRQLEELLLGPEVGPGSRVVISSLDDLVTRLGAAGAVELYTRTCPRMFDNGAIAYWTATRELAGSSVIEGVARIAQCVFELRDGRLRVRKAEGRPARVQGAAAVIDYSTAPPVISREHAAGRLGEGLRRLRSERNLTQTQLATIAGVTPPAISQAESGRRGMSLDTLLPLCESMGVGLDELLGLARRPSPWLGRCDRATADGSTVQLFDGAGSPRVHLVELGPDEQAKPPFAHKGPELLLAASGLVLVDLGSTAPVLRAGDGLMVTDVAVRSWSNLAEGPSTMFWLPLDAP